MTKIKIKFSFLLFNALLFMFRDSRLMWGFYIACILHELGHITAVWLTGGKISCIELSCFGVKMTATPAKTLKSGIFVLLSGPAVNLITFLILSLMGNSGYTAMFSLAESLFNLLPYSFLDGGAVLDLLAEGSENEERLQKFYRFLRITVFLIIITVLFY